MKQEKLWTPEFLSMGGSNFLLFMSQYILVAALPIFIMDKLSGGEMEAGLAMTFFQIGTVICRPLAGRIIDSVDKKHLLWAATLIFFLTMLGFNLFQDLTSIYGLRLLHGAIFALTTTAAAAMAAMVLPVSRKGEGIGYFALSTNLAMVVGPLIGLLLIGQLGADSLFHFLALLALLTVWTANHQQLPPEITQPAVKRRSGWHLTDFVEPGALAMAGLGGLVFFAYGGILTFIPLYAKSLGLQSETSLFFVVFAAVIILSRPLIGRLFDSKGPDYTIYPGFILFIVGLILFSQIASLTGLLAAAAVLGTGFGALSPAFQTLAIKNSAPARAGVATATYFWSLDISVGLSAILLSLAAARWGYACMYGLICPLVLVAATACYAYWRNRHSQYKSS